MRDINIDDLQKLADKQAENFVKIQLDLNSILAFLQLLLNIQAHILSEKFEVPLEAVQTELNQTLVKIKEDANQASLESARLIAELQKKKKGPKKVLYS